jgi:uroporphyrinogen decarboxylase
MNERERYLASLTFADPDHYLLRHSYGLMPGTLARWHHEGLPARIDEADIWDYFGFWRPPPGLPIDFGPHPRIVPETLEETSEHVVIRDAWGTVRKRKKGVTTLALPIRFPIQDEADWARYRHRLQYVPERFAEDWLDHYEALQTGGQPVRVSFRGFYWLPRDLMGDQGLCLSYYTQAGLVHDILQTYADMLYAASERLLTRGTVDELHMAEDMCYKNAMMISPQTFREFMMPHYQRLIGLYRAHGTTLFSVDTDGYLGQLIPLLLEAGVNVVMPCEVQAGNDIVQMRVTYGEKMAFVAGLDKRALADSPTSLVPGVQGANLTPEAAIDAELAYRLPPILEQGGYLGGLDHRVLPDTSLKSFTYYVRQARDYLGIEEKAPAFS